jgi:hypothetical protein
MIAGHPLKFEEILQTEVKSCSVMEHMKGGIELHGLYPKGYLLLQRLELGA